MECVQNEMLFNNTIDNYLTDLVRRGSNNVIDVIMYLVSEYVERTKWQTCHRRL